MNFFIMYMIVLAGTVGLQVHSQVFQPMPSFFKKGSSTAFNWRPQSGLQCKFQCKRKYIGDWSSVEWNLYLQLYKEANRRGYLDAFATEHNYDCNGRDCIFHNSKMLISWHRIFTAHWEQILQKIDHQINPNRASKSGEFCMGYWEWGYQVPFSNSFQDNVYKYMFNAGAMGSLPSGYNHIPDGQLKEANCNGDYLARDPSLGSDNWGTAAVASCLQLRDIEGDGDSSVGFRPCIEYNAHNAVHNNLGGGFSSFRAPQDPIFFLHHGMIDYTWWLWQQSNGNIISNTWSVPLVRPYNGSGWTTQQTLNYKNLCYTYVKPNQVTAAAQLTTVKPPASVQPPPSVLSPTSESPMASSPITGRTLFSNRDLSYSKQDHRQGRKLVGEAPILEVLATASKLTTDVNKLLPVQQLVVAKVLNATTPMAIPKDQFHFLTMHASNPQQAEENYKNHLKAVKLAQDFQNSLKTYFKPTQASIQNPSTDPNSTIVKQVVAKQIGVLTLGS